MPEGFAHGYITLHDETEVLYLISEFHAPESRARRAWDRPGRSASNGRGRLTVISDRDRDYPDYRD